MTVLPEAAVDIMAAADGARFRDPMQARHRLGAVPGTGETVRHVARHRGRRLAPPLFPASAPAVFPAPAPKCGARARRVGRDPRVRSGRLLPVTGNPLFPILPGVPCNPGSRPARFGCEALPAGNCSDEPWYGCPIRQISAVEGSFPVFPEGPEPDVLSEPAPPGG